MNYSESDVMERRWKGPDGSVAMGKVRKRSEQCRGVK